MKKTINWFKNNKFVQNGLTFTIASFIFSVLNYLFNLIIARGFTLNIYGEYASAISYLAILGAPLLVINTVLINKIGKNDGKKQKFYAQAILQWFWKLFKKNIHIVILLIVIFFIFFDKVSQLPVFSNVFIIISILLSVFSSFYTSILQSLKEFFKSGTLSIITGIVKIVGGILIILFAPNLLYLYLLLIFVGIFSIFLGKYMFQDVIKKSKSIKIDFQSKSWLEIIRDKNIILPMITAFALSAILNIDIVLVREFFTIEQVGLYSAISLFGKIILYFTGPLSLVAFTFFADNKGKHNSRKILLISFVLYLGLGIVSVVIYKIFSEQLVLIVFGDKFLLISKYIWLSAIFGTLYSLLTLFTQYMVAKTRKISLLSAFIPISQFILIYFFHSSFIQVLYADIISITVILIIFTLYIFREKSTHKIYVRS